MSKSITSPWIILGDFNCVANLNELKGSLVRLTEVQPLRDCMAMSFMIWNTMGDSIHGLIRKRVINESWVKLIVLGNMIYGRKIFPHQWFTFLRGRLQIILQCLCRFLHDSRLKKPFRFFNCWCRRRVFWILFERYGVLILRVVSAIKLHKSCDC